LDKISNNIYIHIRYGTYEMLKEKKDSKSEKCESPFPEANKKSEELNIYLD
jgi:hypothetical protein